MGFPTRLQGTANAANYFRVAIASAIFSLALFAGAASALAQPGLVDTNFTSGATNPVYDIVVQSDGKLLARQNRVGFMRFLRDGALDPSFQPGLNPGGKIYSVAIQSDGKLLIGGEFTSVQGVPRPCLARLNVDGTVDGSFLPELITTNPPSQFPNDPTNDIAIITPTSDGKILISGLLNMLRTNGAALPGLIRLNSNGSFDDSFPVLTNTPRHIVMQPDGKILMWQDIAVNSYEYDSVITRLNPDGSVDSSFTPPAIEGWINALCPQNDKLFMAGQFWRVNGLSCANAARLSANGSLDLDFHASISAGSVGVAAAVPQDDGKVIIAGGFTVESPFYTNLARLNTDGTTDTTYVPTSTSSLLYALAFQPDGKLVAGGDILAFDGFPARRMVRLMGDSSSGPALFLFEQPNYEVYENAGQIVLTVRRSWGLNGSVSVDYRTQDGSARAGVRYSAQSGTLTFLDGEASKTISIPLIDDSLIQDVESFQVILSAPTGGASIGNPGAATVTVLDNDGPAALDPNFNLGIGGLDGMVKTVIQQPDGRLIVGGVFQQTGPYGRKGVARLNLDGSTDSTFNPGSGLQWTDEPGWGVLATLQPDGRILLAGIFTNVNGSAKNYLVRLNSDGSVDTGFDDGTGPQGSFGLVGDIRGMQVLTNGEIIVGGDFNNYNGTTRNGLTRLFSNGGVDAFYDPSGSSAVVSFDLQVDGKLVYAPITGTQVARLNADGTTDTAALATVGGVFPNIRQIESLADGSTIVAGNFATVSGQPRRCVARLLSNGAVDSGFVPDLSVFQGTSPPYAYKFAVQSDRKIVLALKSYREPHGDYVVRLNSDGTLDTDFEPVLFTIPVGDNDTIWCIAIQADGGIMVGGEFQSVNGLSRPYLVRLRGGARSGTRPPIVKSLQIISGQPQLVLSVPPARSVVLQASTNLSDWVPISTNTSPVSTLIVNDSQAGNSPRRFYRILEHAP